MLPQALLDDARKLSGASTPSESRRRRFVRVALTSPTVVIAGTHVDDMMCSQAFVDAAFQRLLRAIGGHARRVRACVPVSCATSENIVELQRRVRRDSRRLCFRTKTHVVVVVVIA